jgi:peroxisomal membrane protein 4
VNLGTFAFIYKSLVCILRKIFGRKSPIFAFIAGIVGSYYVFREKTSVNQQIALYLLSRILTGGAQRLANAGVLPNSNAFGVMSVMVWGIVMFLFDEDSSVLQPSLTSSMDFIYRESDQWKSFKDFIPFYLP